MVTGINHITLSVRNANESFSFYTDVLGFKPIARYSVFIFSSIGAGYKNTVCHDTSFIYMNFSIIGQKDDYRR